MYISVDDNSFREIVKSNPNVVIFDVRMKEEFDEDHICNAIHADVLNEDSFIEAIKGFDKTKTYLVYCMSGRRSLRACALLEEYNFNSIYNLEGGILRYGGEICQEMAA